MVVMAKIERIEQEIKSLSQEELAEFREWFYEYDSEEWDRRIEADLRNGKLDKLASEAVESHRLGETRKL